MLAIKLDVRVLDLLVVVGAEGVLVSHALDMLQQPIDAQVLRLQQHPGAEEWVVLRQ